MSASFQLDRADLRKLGRSVLIASLGAAIPILADFFADTDFGLAGPLVTALGSVAVDLLRRFVGPNSGNSPDAN